MVPYERITAGKKLPEKGGEEMKGAILEKGETGYTYLKKLFLSIRHAQKDFNWLIDIFATMTDNTDTYDFVFYEDSETLPGHLKRICSVDKISLANFLNEDQGYKSGISMYGHYIACKCLDISSEREYMNQYTDIRILTNEIKPC